MELEKLQIELRPRSNAQALDLGLAVLHANGANAWLAWLVLWLPLVLLCMAGAAWKPDWTWTWFLLSWWPRPLIERATLYVLSRQVFGEQVSWRDALRAWPSQLHGGVIELMTWGRPFAVGRCLLQPMWQLEQARGKVASLRRKVLKRDATGRAAVWYGVVCAHLEVVLQLGVFAAIGLFMGDGDSINPFALFMPGASAAHPVLQSVLAMGTVGLSGAIIGPVYVASGFTLYLNRRARLEAWDLEIALRQITPPQRHGVKAALLALLAAPLLALALGQATPAHAASADAQRTDCKPDASNSVESESRTPDRDAAQQALRAQVDALYRDPDLRGYECVDTWRRKNHKDEPQKKNGDKLPDLAWVAILFKAVAIGAAIALVAWLIYRYRDAIPMFAITRSAAATEVGGLDIRPNSLPADVPGAVRDLWSNGERRAALALLYRATLARMVEDNALALHQGDTEGDCLRAAHAAAARGQLSAARLACASAATALWTGAAYGDRWPGTATVLARCDEWRASFDAGAP